MKDIITVYCVCYHKTDVFSYWTLAVPNDWVIIDKQDRVIGPGINVTDDKYEPDYKYSECECGDAITYAPGQTLECCSKCGTPRQISSTAAMSETDTLIHQHAFNT